MLMLKQNQQPILMELLILLLIYLLVEGPQGVP